MWRKFRVSSVVFFILFCDCQIFVAFCCNNYVLWPCCLVCPEACDSLLCFQRFFLLRWLCCVCLLSFRVFFLLQCGNLAVFLILMNSVHLKPDTQNVLSVTMLKFPRLGAESKQHFNNITLKKLHPKQSQPTLHHPQHLISSPFSW